MPKEPQAQRRFRYYVATSLDGFIADRNGSVDWLTPFFATDYGFSTFMASVDTAIAGRKTFEHTLALTGGKGTGMRTVVLTSGTINSAPPETSVTSDLPGLVSNLRATPGKDIWVMGGSIAARSLHQAGALDTLDLHIMPVVLGIGTPLFGSLPTPLSLRLQQSHTFPNGVVSASYLIGR